MKISTCRILLLAAVSLAAACAPMQEGAAVRTASGLVLPAHQDAAVRVYKGIPYASVPVRWRAPEAASTWSGARVADESGPPCPQGDFTGVADPRPASEDCLSLNIWTPAEGGGEGLPVMVWIHGGAFVAGSNDGYDGAALAEKGVVLVAINYRLGALGFFTHPLLSVESPEGSSGNYALLDAIAALEWVRDNISGFGGNPDNVTIFGQSAGAEMVNLLLVSPKAEGLFHRAIAESGGSMGWRQPRTLAQSETLGEQLARDAGARTLEDLRALPFKTLTRLGGRSFEPVIENTVYPVDQRAVMEMGRQQRVPIIVGSTADEGQLSDTLTAEAYVEDVKRRYAHRAQDYLRLFPGEEDEQARLSAKQGGTLGAEYIEATIADEHAAVSSAYQYRFVRKPPAVSAAGAYAADRQGAYHGAELPYVFANLSKEPRQWQDVDRRLEHAISNYWVNFARTGNPNGPDLPHWPAIDPRAPQVIQFGEAIETVERPNGDVIEALETIFYGPNGVFRISTTADSPARQPQ